MVIRADPEHVHKASNESLPRLEVDIVSLCYLYRSDSAVPLERTVAAIVKLVK